uniref:Uncharacterized protein n=1 Tax=Cacopsylla melanoneura TaxID=428564 RepID=A0A8D8ZBL1_9HEMI
MGKQGSAKGILYTRRNKFGFWGLNEGCGCMSCFIRKQETIRLGTSSILKKTSPYRDLLEFLPKNFPIFTSLFFHSILRNFNEIYSFTKPQVSRFSHHSLIFSILSFSLFPLPPPPP